jgi:outer membrane PBP1 activator LpoA protein
MRLLLSVMALAMVLAACGEQKKDVKDTVFAPQVKALEKVRSVENTLKQGEEKNREALELSEKPTPPEQR